MKSYTITVNGNVYDVTVEEKGAGLAPAAPVRRAAAPVAAPAIVPKTCFASLKFLSIPYTTKPSDVQ